MAASYVSASPARPRTARNVVANFAGRVCTVVLGIAVVPIYLRTLGAEGYGLIGLFTALQTVLALFDFGLGTTLNRQLALHDRTPLGAQRARDFTRTVEALYWLVAVAVALVWLLLAPLVATRWINARGLGQHEVRVAVGLMGVAAAAQFPFALYGGGLLGLQRQVLYNGALIVLTALRTVGAALVVRLVSPTVVAFFVWQAAISALHSIVGAVLLWSSLPPSEARPRIDWAQLTVVRAFIAGTGGLAVLGVLLSQVDKAVLSRILPLAAFGYYALAGVFGASVYLLAQPIYMAYFPRLSEFVARGDEGALIGVYHEASQLLSVVLLPTAAVASLFARQVLLVWTHDPHVADQAGLAASLLIASYACVALYGLPQTLLLAHGRTRLPLQVVMWQIALGVPIIVTATLRLGAVGAAAAWIAINGGALCAAVVSMHRRLLVGEGRRWLTQDVAPTAAASVGVAALAKWIMPATLHGPALLGYIVLVSCATLAAAVVATPLPRAVLRQQLRRASPALRYGR